MMIVHCLLQYWGLINKTMLNFWCSGPNGRESASQGGGGTSPLCSGPRNTKVIDPPGSLLASINYHHISYRLNLGPALARATCRRRSTTATLVGFIRQCKGLPIIHIVIAIIIAIMINIIIIKAQKHTALPHQTMQWSSSSSTFTTSSSLPHHHHLHHHHFNPHESPLSKWLQIPRSREDAPQSHPDQGVLVRPRGLRGDFLIIWLVTLVTLARFAMHSISGCSVCGSPCLSVQLRYGAVWQGELGSSFFLFLCSFYELTVCVLSTKVLWIDIPFTEQNSHIAFIPKIWILFLQLRNQLDILTFRRSNFTCVL